MTEEFLVPTGSIVKEYLEHAEMKQKEFAQRLGISEKHVSNFLNGKTKLTEELAIKIERVLPPTPASYWLNYEKKYQEYLARKKEESLYTQSKLRELSKTFHFKEVFQGMNWSLQKQANEMLKLLRISNFENFEPVYVESQKIDFMEDGGTIESIAVWLGMAREEIEIQNPKKISSTTYNRKGLEKSFKRFKNIALDNNCNTSLKSARKLLNRLGVYLVFCEPITNSKVRGALTSYENVPTIYLSGRFKTHDNVWFALMHEIGHLFLHYEADSTLVTLEDEEIPSQKEKEANEFARDFFISQDSYDKFIRDQKGNISESSIKIFAASQNVLPGIVLGRLQHDKFVSYGSFNYLKNKV